MLIIALKVCGALAIVVAGLCLNAVMHGIDDDSVHELLEGDTQ